VQLNASNIFVLFKVACKYACHSAIGSVTVMYIIDQEDSIQITIHL